MQELVEDQKNKNDQTNLAKKGAKELDNVQGALADGLDLGEAIGGSEIAETIHADDQTLDIKSNIKEVTGEDDKEISVQGFLDPGIMKVVPQDAQMLTSYVANKALFWLITDVLGMAAGTSLKWDPTSISLAQIKKKIDDLQKDMNTLLDADFQAAFSWLDSASTALKYENYESAYNKLEKVLNCSVRAYSQLKTFEKKVFCKKMTICSKRLLQCYNKDLKTFNDLYSLPLNKQKELYEDVISDVDKILNEFSEVKEPNWYQRKVNKARTKSEEQNVLDGLLKAALPIIWHHHEAFRVKKLNDMEMTKYLPDGKEDAAEILYEGKWPIIVWKNDIGWLDYEFQNRSEVDEKIRVSTFKSIFFSL